MLRCYLLPQKKELGAGSVHIDVTRGISEEEVSLSVLSVSLFLSLIIAIFPIVYFQSTDRSDVSW